MEIGGLSDYNYCWHACGVRDGKGNTGGGGAGIRGEAPLTGGGGGAPDCHETNLKCFMNKLCHEMRHDL